MHKIEMQKQPQLRPAEAIPVNCRPNPHCTSLSRMNDLQAFLMQCENPSYVEQYMQLLEDCPLELMEEFENELKRRSKWLACEEQHEYNRAKHLNVLPAPKKDTALIVPDRVIFEEQPSLELLASESKENQATVQDHWQGISPYELEKAIQRMAQSVSPQHRRQKPCSQIC